MSDLNIIHTYRALYRAGLQAIHYAKPARYDLRNTLRSAFREEPRSNFSASRIANTLEFLHRARQNNGMEHRILKTILHVKWWRQNTQLGKSLIADQTPLSVHIRRTAYANFDETLRMFNATQGLCLR